MTGIQNDLVDKAFDCAHKDRYEALLDALKCCSDLDQLISLLSQISQKANVISENHEKYHELIILLFGFTWDVSNEAIRRSSETSQVKPKRRMINS